ncbi:MAG: glucose-6-phosphate isomerase [Opitutus sp.]|nr:glucose-6-phosphate isomerase [Opitutus sp.]MCS6248325.1 glucose-6-phosphate isomerase [Opitutus sp.]MCS6273575.1 glucose-6-phosphate isomerase [Opitutus sp.]MCS6278559.1 glucose-6-phosphate isomerase [Opitutus sp.]MCS6300039.1 glucose-6-phosphate isomerase [Opitutus sp.]
MNWSRFKTHYYQNSELGLALDISRIPFPDGFLASKEPAIQQAYADMAALEKGAIANPDENRMVGHYWLRAPQLAPTPALAKEISDTLAAIKSFAADVHAGKILGSTGKTFTQLLVIGIGGSALGPQLVNHALGRPGADKLAVSFFDNTDPDGIDYVLGTLAGKLPETIAVVISKSGGTAETRNGQLEAAAAFKAAGLDFTKHYVAVTGAGSKLEQTALAQNWLARFPMWDWVGGRTSELSAVGLLPAALQGIDIQAILDGAAAVDAVTRSTKTSENPAALLALMWYYATDGKGTKDMVVLPYKDRLLLFSRYLQQLVMESLGKEFDLKGNVVNQGIAVYGNKGSTDQHAYVQQLREGVNNFFVTFIEVLKDRDGASFDVEPGVTTGDFLQGFYLGTRDALSEKNRTSISITLADISPRSLGILIGLYERVVGFYASLVGINAYHQPGVEAGKKAAGSVITLKLQITAHLKANAGQTFTADTLAAALGSAVNAELVFKVLEHLAANGSVKKTANTPWFASTYSA